MELIKSLLGEINKHMNTLQNFFVKIALAAKSRTVWSIVALFATELQGVQNQIPPKYLPYVQVVLALAGAYFRMNPRTEVVITPPQDLPPIESLPE